MKENLKVAELAGETNSQRTKYLFRVESVVEFPKLEWGIIVGDAIHCLRSAMDQLVYGLAEQKTSETAFPICRTKREWIVKAPAAYWSLHPGIVALIDRVQPYHDGNAAANHPLALVSALSNLDKHRTIPTVALVAYDTEATVTSVQGIAKWETIRFHPGRTYEPGAVVAESKIVPDDSGLEPHMDVKITANFEVGFGLIPEARWLNGKPIIVTFNETLGGYVVEEVFNRITTIWNTALEEVLGLPPSTEKG
jgi:hypothetical protein